MRPLSRLQNVLYQIGGLLLVVGAALPLTPLAEGWAVGVFALGALLFVPMQVLARYDGRNLVVRRLRRQQLIGASAIVLTAVLLFMHWQHLRPFRADEWKLTLTLAAVLQVYSAFRIPAELEREARSKP